MSAQPDALAPALAPSAWSDACLAAALMAVDPKIGVVLRAGAGPAREEWLSALCDLLPASATVRKLPSHVADGRLLGGLDLAASLRAGRPVAERGLLAQADGGVLVVAMAERLAGATAAHIAAALDNGEIVVEREGVAMRAAARFGVVALDEGQSDDEAPPAALCDRLGFHLDMTLVSHRDLLPPDADSDDVACARAALAMIDADDRALTTLVVTAARLGVASLRAPLLALRAARAACALRGGGHVGDDDLTIAARLVLASRATLAPAQEQSEPPPPEEPDSNEPSKSDEQPESEPTELSAADLEDMIVAAAVAAIPSGLLDRIAAGQMARAGARNGKAGVGVASKRRGRPLGARPGALRDGRLALVDTLRAAAPWQPLRRRAADATDVRRVIVVPDDFRILRFRERTESLAIFVVDASGSSAMQRLAEVKGAIELLLADCYIRRDSVAMVAFRGRDAEIVLPPTRSLARAKRTLAGMPGGGGTPVAAGLDMALALADQARRKGQSPLIVLMTDGRANISRDGQPGRERAFADALDAARKVRAAGIAALAIDTSPARQDAPDAPTARLGQAMAARTLRLPQADAGRLSQAVRAASGG